MSTNKKLKAFVRFDGKGEIVAGSLILAQIKPKVGKWKEIPSTDCCNFTTTTTTQSPTSVITTTVYSCTNYTWSVNEINYNSSGTYTYINNNIVYILELSIYSMNEFGEMFITACNSYNWFGTEYITSGDYFHSNPLGAGECPVDCTLHLTINNC